MNTDPLLEPADTSASSGDSTESDVLSNTPRIVYFSSVTESTLRFVEKVGYPAERIPLYANREFLNVDYDYVLIVPTYGGGEQGGAVPKQVIKFLNDETNRGHCLGVIASGNTNFGSGYCLAGKIISSKLQVPLLYNFEIMGTAEDVKKVRDGLSNFWNGL